MHCEKLESNASYQEVQDPCGKEPTVPLESPAKRSLDDTKQDLSPEHTASVPSSPVVRISQDRSVAPEPQSMPPPRIKSLIPEQSSIRNPDEEEIIRFVLHIAPL